MSAQTESKEASFQMLISKHALVRPDNLDTRLLGQTRTGGLVLQPKCQARQRPPVLRAGGAQPRGNVAIPRDLDGSDGKMSYGRHVPSDLPTPPSPSAPPLPLAEWAVEQAGHDAPMSPHPALQKFQMESSVRLLHSVPTMATLTSDTRVSAEPNPQQPEVFPLCVYSCLFKPPATYICG